MVWTCDPEGNITSHSPRWLALTGQGPGEPPGRGWIVALHEGDVARTIEQFSACLASGEPVDVDYRVRVAGTDTVYRWMLARAFPRRDGTGRIIRWYGVVEDIHDRKTAEAALRDNVAFMQRVLASSSDCMKVLDLEGRLTFMSASGMKAMEVTRFADIASWAWTAFWEDEGWVEAEAALVAARAGGSAQFESAAKTMGGTMRWWDVRVTPIVGADGTPEKLLAVSRDITEERRARDALADSEKRYPTLFNSLGEGFCVIEFLDGPQ